MTLTRNVLSEIDGTSRKFIWTGILASFLSILLFTGPERNELSIPKETRKAYDLTREVLPVNQVREVYVGPSKKVSVRYISGDGSEVVMYSKDKDKIMDFTDITQNGVKRTLERFGGPSQRFQGTYSRTINEADLNDSWYGKFRLIDEDGRWRMVNPEVAFEYQKIFSYFIGEQD